MASTSRKRLRDDEIEALIEHDSEVSEFEFSDSENSDYEIEDQAVVDAIQDNTENDDELVARGPVADSNESYL